MSYRYALAQHGLTLATRPVAADLRLKLTEQAAERDLLELDFTDILGISSSFADELVARLAEESQIGKVKFDIAMSGASSEVEAVVNRAVERREAKLAQLS
jgi:hypothetical protein